MVRMCQNFISQQACEDRALENNQGKARLEVEKASLEADQETARTEVGS